jgi:acetyl-CoA synthetase
MTDGYEDARSAFRWQVPARFNIGVDACDRWADGSGRPALIYETEGGEVRRFSFDAMKESSNRLANCWRRAGIEVGDRVAILLPQAPETGIAHLAAYKSGAVAVPLFTLFGPDALQFRLADSGARILVTDANGLAKVRPLLEDLPALERIYCIDDETDPPSLTSEVTGAPDGSGVTVTRPGAVEEEASAPRCCRFTGRLLTNPIVSSRSTRRPTTRPSSSTRPARPASPRGSCTAIASCSATCLGWKCPTGPSREMAT